jgi:branched-chain amino acid transport system substrate-binding protein
MKKLLLVALTLSSALLLSACGGSDDTVRLGVIGPLTGDYSMYGVSVRNGAQLAVDELNADGGILGLDVELIAYDSKGDAVEGVNAYNRLLDQDEIHALIGATFSGVTLAIKELAITDGLPILTPTATHPDVTLDAPNIFRACYTDSYQGSVAAVFVDETLEADTVAVLYNRDDAYSEGLAIAFTTEAELRGLTVLEYTFGGQEDDYNVVLTSIDASAAEVVFLPGYVAEVGAILTQANDLGIDIPFVGGDGWDSIEMDYAAVAEGNYFLNHYAKTDESAIVQNFVNNYTAEFGESPSALAALAYDAVYAMALAMENAGSLDFDEVVAALANINLEVAVTGSIIFDADGNPIKSVTIIQIVDGQHVVVAKIEG